MDGLPSVPTQVLPLLQSESEVALARIKSVPQGWVSVIRCFAVVSANILLAGGSEWRELDDLEVPWSVQGSKHGPWNHQYNMFNLKMALNSLNFFPLFKVKEWRIGRFVSINSTCFFFFGGDNPKINFSLHSIESWHNWRWMSKGLSMQLYACSTGS